MQFGKGNSQSNNQFSYPNYECICNGAPNKQIRPKDTLIYINTWLPFDKGINALIKLEFK